MLISRLGIGRALLALALALLGTEAVPAELDVVVHDGRIDVSADAVPLSQVLDRIAAAIDAEVEYDGPPPSQVVTLALLNQTPADVFVSVLQDQGTDFALQMDAAGTRVVRVLIAAESSVSVQDHVAPPPPGPVERPTLPEAIQKLLTQADAEGDASDAEVDDSAEERDEEPPETPALPEALERLINQLRTEGELPTAPPRRRE